MAANGATGTSRMTRTFACIIFHDLEKLLVADDGPRYVTQIFPKSQVGAKAEAEATGGSHKKPKKNESRATV